MPVAHGTLALVLAWAPAAARADGAPAFSGMRPAPVTPKQAPTAQGRLDNARRALTQAQAALARANPANYAGNLEKAQAAVTAVLADLNVAEFWLKANPKENALPNGPAPTEPPSVRPASLPAGERTPGVNLLTALEGLNLALNEFVNNPAPTYRGPVIGALGGHREKIMADIGAASSAVIASIRTANQAANAPQRRPGN